MSDMYPPPPSDDQNAPQQPASPVYPPQPTYQQAQSYAGGGPGYPTAPGFPPTTGPSGIPGAISPYVRTNLAEYWRNARNGKRNLSILAAAFVIFALIGSLTSSFHGDNSGSSSTALSNSASSGQSTNRHSTTPAVTNAPVATKAPAPTDTPAPSFAHFDDGTFQVGKDIQPGTYRTRMASPGCYYARLKGFSGTVGDIIANDNTNGPAVITIKSSDAGFQSQNCGTWTQDLSQITSSKTTFDEGTFIVGTDIEPGTYKNDGSQGCYYARLSGFGGTLDEIIANDNTDSVAIVTISASDKGFQSARCGAWVRQ